MTIKERTVLLYDAPCTITIFHPSKTVWVAIGRLHGQAHGATTTVSFDDGATNGETHSHTLRFGRKKSIKNPLGILRINFWPGILHRDSYVFAILRFGF